MLWVTIMINHPGYQKPTNTTETMNSNFGFVSFTVIVCYWRL